MPSKAMVPNTETRTSTMGNTAINPSAGWRTVTQKKRARTVKAAATVVPMVAVCCSVMASVTVNEMMLDEVAVKASSLPNQSCSISCRVFRVRAVSPAKAKN